MARRKKLDPTKAALLIYDYAAFCLLDWIDNADHGIAITPALSTRLDLLREARKQGDRIVGAGSVKRCSTPAHVEGGTKP